MIQSTDRPHRVTHFQYTSWPDHGVPLHPSSLVKFAQEVRKVHSNSQAPMVVHCRWDTHALLVKAAVLNAMTVYVQSLQAHLIGVSLDLCYYARSYDFQIK